MNRERTKPLSLSEIEDLLVYDENSLTGLRWVAENPKNNYKPKTHAGNLLEQQSGNIFTVIINKKHYKAHRIVYSLYYKVDVTTEDYIIHLDGNKLNNRISNLEKITIDEHHQLCTMCSKVKPKSEFSKNRHLRGGVSIYCKECTAENIKVSEYSFDFSKYVVYDESCQTKLRKISYNPNPTQSERGAGSLRYGTIKINHTKYSIAKVILALHGIITNYDQSVRFKDGNVRNLTFDNLEVTTKMRVRNSIKSKEYKEKLLNNLNNKKERKMWSSAKERAAKNNLQFTIQPSDIKIPEICPILGIPLFSGNGKVHANSPSLDRIIPSIGYTPENVWVISHKANSIKSNATKEELIAFAEWVLRELK